MKVVRNYYGGKIVLLSLAELTSIVRVSLSRTDFAARLEQIKEKNNAKSVAYLCERELGNCGPGGLLSSYEIRIRRPRRRKLSAFQSQKHRITGRGYAMQVVHHCCIG